MRTNVRNIRRTCALCGAPQPGDGLPVRGGPPWRCHPCMQREIGEVDDVSPDDAAALDGTPVRHDERVCRYFGPVEAPVDRARHWLADNDATPQLESDYCARIWRVYRDRTDDRTALARGRSLGLMHGVTREQAGHVETLRRLGIEQGESPTLADFAAAAFGIDPSDAAEEYRTKAGRMALVALKLAGLLDWGERDRKVRFVVGTKQKVKA